jgi:hypothetical protein
VLAGVWAAAVALGLLAGAVAVYRIQTDNGELIITADTPDVEVVVRQKGQVVRILDAKTNKKVKLHPGLYDLQLNGPPDGRTLSPNKVTIRRGQTTLARVEWTTRTPSEPRESDTRTYLSDLQEFECIVGFGTLLKGKNLSGDIITTNGVKSYKGLLIHPPSEGFSTVKYRLGGLEAYAVEAKVAIDDAVRGSATPLTFQVVGDGKVLWSSKPIQARGDTQDCRVEVGGVQVLELRVVCPGWYGRAHAVWVDPYLLSKKR